MMSIEQLFQLARQAAAVIEDPDQVFLPQAFGPKDLRDDDQRLLLSLSLQPHDL